MKQASMFARGGQPGAAKTANACPADGKAAIPCSENDATETPPKPPLAGESGSRDAGERPGAIDVAVYEMTGPFTTWMWLCTEHLALMKTPEAGGWTAKKVETKVAPAFCDCCLRRERAMAKGAKNERSK